MRGGSVSTYTSILAGSHCVLICTPMMINECKYFLMYLLAICISFFEKCSCISSACFYIRLFVVFDVECMSILCALDIISLLNIAFANIFSYSVGFLFVFLMVFFTAQKLSQYYLVKRQFSPHCKNKYCLSHS